MSLLRPVAINKFSISRKEMDASRIIFEPSECQKFWDFKLRNYLIQIQAHVYFIQNGLTLNVPLPWIQNFHKCAYWTAQKQFTCYYSTDPEAPNTTPFGVWSVPRARKLNKQGGHLYTVNVLKLFGMLLNSSFLSESTSRSDGDIDLILFYLVN